MASTRFAARGHTPRANVPRAPSGARGMNHYDMRDVVEGLRGMRAAGQNCGPVLDTFKDMLRADIYQHFDDAMAAGGSWPGYAESTVKRLADRKGGRYKRGKRKGMPSRKTQRRLQQGMLGHIKSAWKVKQGPTYLEFRNMVPWADVHNEGGRAGHASEPQREFAYLSPEIPALFGEAIAAHVAMGWV